MGGQGRARRVFAVAPPAPTLRAALDGSYNGTAYGLPPRAVCDECGAQSLKGQMHAAWCAYAGYPAALPDGAVRPSLGEAARLADHAVCNVCRVELDRPRGEPLAGRFHAWWCTWWDLHPNADEVPF